MQALEFQEDFTITAMLSAEGERVAFVNIIDPREKGVEHWMSEIEKMMQISVRWVLKVSIDDYLVRDRNDWILNHPG